MWIVWNNQEHCSARCAGSKRGAKTPSEHYRGTFKQGTEPPYVQIGPRDELRTEVDGSFKCKFYSLLQAVYLFLTLSSPSFLSSYPCSPLPLPRLTTLWRLWMQLQWKQLFLSVKRQSQKGIHSTAPGRLRSSRPQIRRPQSKILFTRRSHRMWPQQPPWSLQPQRLRPTQKPKKENHRRETARGQRSQEVISQLLSLLLMVQQE